MIAELLEIEMAKLTREAIVRAHERMAEAQLGEAFAADLKDDTDDQPALAAA